MDDDSPLHAIEHRVWQLQRPDGTIRSRQVVLQAGGAISGYRHANEASWTPQDGGIAFLSADGTITSITQSMSRDPSGAWRLALVHPHMRGKPAHILAEWPNGRETPVLVRSDRRHMAAGQAAGLAHLLGGTLLRATLLANNPDIGATLDALAPDAADLLVQFNRPLYFARMRNSACHKLHVFNARMGRFWGFDDDGAPLERYEDQAFESLTLLFANQPPRSEAAYLAGLPPAVHTVTILPFETLPRFTYPAGKWPSAGYTGVTVLLAVNELRHARGAAPLQIALAGFTGRYPPGGAWSGHDFAFEQASYQSWRAAGLLRQES